MKLNCYVEMYDRVFLCKRKPQLSILSFVKHQTGEKKEVELLWQTRQQKRGTRYRIIKNVNKLYLAHIDQGKSTISFAEPPHDLLIQGDRILLKKFVRFIDHVSKGNHLPEEWLRVPSSFTVETKEVVVKKKSDYPTLQGFPKTTERLYLSGLGRRSFDRQILRLQSLRILNLENNEISYLPKELGSLPHLEQLLLSGNCLGNSTSLANKWAWMEQVAISKSLKELDMSNNKIVTLPLQIAKLSALIHLNISQNLLQIVSQEF
ncbi:leucine-rich repeat protein 1-like isoform X2 [Pseudomyrmex gracilis]|uniref:leucine-rich repeat protein 1-like isoform X2 n=1 Tax=Pseudomyrmex gracilis TaxID=219809 RepID=UPI00099578C8|nr:leucine-rich repeat protein 1-like isoform X2 [Pseudomyrmex gracilis]